MFKSMRQHFAELMSKYHTLKELEIDIYPFQFIIQKWASAYKLDPILVRALIQTESSFNVKAYRYEPEFYKRYIKGNPKFLNHKYYNEPKRISASLGLMQIMLTTAMQYYRDLDFEDLYDPDLNIEIGCRILADKIKRYGLERGILAYNSGSPRKQDPKEEHNYVYLTKVAKYYKIFGGQNPNILQHTN